MSSTADKIKRLEQLLAEVRQESDQQTPEAMAQEETREAFLPERKADDGRKPDSLDGLNHQQILLLERDGVLTGEEKTWLNTRRNIPYGGMPRLSQCL